MRVRVEDDGPTGDPAVDVRWAWADVGVRRE
jgi:hypothetical protein